MPRSPSPRSRSRSRGDRRDRSPPRRGSKGETRLYIGNLSFKTRQKDLDYEFSRYGRIVDVYLPEDQEGRPRGFGFVTFEDGQDAEDAIRGMDRRELDGREITVNVARDKDSSAGKRHGGAPPCRDLARGDCTYGDRCKFSHGDVGRSRSRSPRRRRSRSRSRSDSRRR